MTGKDTQRNVLFIMCDQLRFDYLSCFGHPHLETPNIDGLAARGVRFSRAYVQSPICVPSRMSFYTGRYVHSHGCTWNQIPLRVGEPTLGDHLRPLGVRTALAGKTHMSADLAGMARLGIDPASDMGVLIAQCGFEPFERHDGLHPDGRARRPAYDTYLRDRGFDAPNPWHEWANAAAGEDGEILSGWLMENADKPARIPAEHSETAYMTGRALDFMEEAGDQNWCLHLSYIKPHWPYIAPAPYHALYGANQVLPAVRSQAERDSAHPVFAAFMAEVVSRTMSDDTVRARVVPAYMGLVKEIDDQLGRLLEFMEERGLMDNTMIVFTSDHGDYLGDHWLGEKELFHEPSVRFPLIVFDPRADANATRGTVSDALVEAIDLAPTFIEYFGGTPPGEILEGRALTPWLHGKPPGRWRDVVFSEYDYSNRIARKQLDVPVADARMVMAFDGRWKYILVEGFPPMLFDLESDPEELTDLGAAPEHEAERDRLREAIFAWLRRHHSRITISDEEIERRYGTELPDGIVIGYWDQDQVDRDLNRERE